MPETIRTSVYAFDRCITGAIGAAFTPLAGILAERVFGFKSPPHHAAGGAPPPTGAAAAHAAAQIARTNVVNARALENGLLWTMVVPMIIKFCIYFLLYWTLPKDRIEFVADGGGAGDEEEGGGGGEASKGKSPRMRISPQPPLEEEEQDVMEEPVIGRAPPVAVATSPALRRSASGLGREGSLGSSAAARQALAAQVLATAQGGRTHSLGQERAQRAASLQRNGSRGRSMSIDSVATFFALEVAPPGAATPRGTPLAGKVSHA